METGIKPVNNICLFIISIFAVGNSISQNFQIILKLDIEKYMLCLQKILSADCETEK